MSLESGITTLIGYLMQSKLPPKGATQPPSNSSRKHAYIILTPLNPTFI